MTEVTANFETGVNGNNITTGDAGSATAWNAVTLTAAGTATYDNAHVNSGALAFKTTSPTSGCAFLQWSSSAIGTITTTTFGRFYVYLAGYPSGNIDLWALVKADGSGACCRFRMSNAGVLLMLNAASGTIATFATTIPTNQWIRIEWRVIPSITVGEFEGKLWTTADSNGTPTETQTTTAQVLAANYGIARHGTGAANVVYTTGLWMDDIVVAATSYPGPVVVAAQVMLPQAMIVR